MRSRRTRIVAVASLDDSVDKFLSPDWLTKEVASKITIRQLLTHTPGIASYIDNPSVDTVRGQFSELNDFQVLFKEEKFNYSEPGTAYRYSNTGMFLLGVVIENVSGQTYSDYVRQHIYAPAGMENTACYPMDIPVPNLAIGYYERNGKTINNMYTLYRGGPAGGGFSTTGDLFKFSRALTQHTLLSREFTEMATSSKAELNAPNYGFGFQVRPSNGQKAFGHSGGSEGVSTRMEVIPKNEITIVVLSNSDEPAEQVTKKIREIVRHIKE